MGKELLALMSRTWCWMWKRSKSLWFLSPGGAIMKSKEEAVTQITTHGNKQSDADLILTFNK